MDAYDLEARHAPAVLAVLPLILLAVVTVPDVRASLALPAVFAAAVIAAIYGLLARVARARGRDREVELYETWGGNPTTAMLRHRDTRLNQHTKQRYHERLRALGPSVRIPTPAEEQADPTGADALYESAMDEVRVRAKKTKNPAVHRENISYGCARNLLGLKPLGIGITLLCLALLTLTIWARTGGILAATQVADAAIGAILLLGLLASLILVTPRMVRHQAEAYAKALLETVETP